MSTTSRLLTWRLVVLIGNFVCQCVRSPDYAGSCGKCYELRCANMVFHGESTHLTLHSFTAVCFVTCCRTACHTTTLDPEQVGCFTAIVVHLVGWPAVACTLALQRCASVTQVVVSSSCVQITSARRLIDRMFVMTPPALSL